MSKPAPPASDAAAEASVAASSGESCEADAPNSTCESTSSFGSTGVEVSVISGLAAVPSMRITAVSEGSSRVAVRSRRMSSQRRSPGRRRRGCRTRSACRRSRSRRAPPAPRRPGCGSAVVPVTWASSESSRLSPRPFRKTPRARLQRHVERDGRRVVAAGLQMAAGPGLAVDLDHVHRRHPGRRRRIGGHVGAVDGQRAGELHRAVGAAVDGRLAGGGGGGDVVVDQAEAVEVEPEAADARRAPG